MILRLTALLAVLAFVAAGCGSDDGDKSSGASVAEAAAEQLRYLDPQSSSVVAIDLRWNGDNWGDVKPLIERMLKAAREGRPPGERSAVPETAENALEQLVGFARLSFAKDVEPALDGHLLIGAVVPPGAYRDPDEDGTFDAGNPPPEPEITFVYRTEKGDLKRIAEKIASLDSPESLKPLRGYEDTVTLDGEIAIVGTETLVWSWSGGTGDRPLRAALDRAKDGGGMPADRLAQAERDSGMTDPLVLATGDLTVARQLVAEEGLERGREEIPYLRALRRASAALDVGDDAVEANARLVTDGEPLEATDLPVAAPGDLELPKDRDVIGGASRDQSVTTTFLSRMARSLFADSRFVKAVEKAEKDLGIRFEDEVLRQFSCPSVSVLEPADPERSNSAPRFGARSCVDDPDRMRELLPRLSPHLPAILTGLQGLGDEGLTALLLLAPDAPLTPGALLGQIDVNPFADAKPDEDLFEVSGLRDFDDAAAQAGPDTLVFGLIGDAFVVASDIEMARRAAGLETEELDGEAGSALRVPLGVVLSDDEDDADAKAVMSVFGDLAATLRAEPEATVAEARLAIKD